MGVIGKGLLSRTGASSSMHLLYMASERDIILKGQHNT